MFGVLRCILFFIIFLSLLIVNWVLLICCKMCLVCLSNILFLWVSVIFFLFFLNRVILSCCLNFLIEIFSVGCVICSCCVVKVKFFYFVMVIK